VKRIERPFTTIHPSTLLALEGMDIEVRRKIAAFRKQQAWLAWAFMNIIDVLHKSGVLHNDLSPSNILLHFPPELPEDVYIGVCDWGMASWSSEEPLSLNWARDEADLQAKKTARWWIAPEMWYMLPQEVDGVVVSPGTKQTKNTMKSEAYATGKLTRYIYNDASSSTLFKGCDTTRVMLNRVLDGLTKDDPKERWTVAHAVNSMKANPGGCKLRSPKLFVAACKFVHLPNLWKIINKYWNGIL
jgi:serine/threonine protein kinase